ncbi:MAG: serine--tRNA ligase, partial [Candidatus Marinimicrobia bacterium]|nr:serine--tRNA ligase [Candidatus Neomarinimicrobiota bacterium]
MLDIKLIRDNKDLIKEAARKKHIDFNVDKLLDLDSKRRVLLQEAENLRAQKNEASDKIAQSSSEGEKEKLISEMKLHKERLSRTEEDLKKVDEKWKSLMLEVPNIPDPSVPEGKTDAENKEIRKWGELPHFDFEPKDHITLLQDLDLASLKRGSKVAGFRGYFLKNEG